MENILIENAELYSFYMFLEFEHPSTSSSLKIQEIYSRGKVSLSRPQFAGMKKNFDNSGAIFPAQSLCDLGILRSREFFGLEKLLSFEWAESFLPQLDELDDNAIANFELIDWFRQFGFEEQKIWYEIVGAVEIERQALDELKLKKKNFVSFTGNKKRVDELSIRRETLKKLEDPKQFAKLHMNSLKRCQR